MSILLFYIISNFIIGAYYWNTKRDNVEEVVQRVIDKRHAPWQFVWIIMFIMMHFFIIPIYIWSEIRNFFNAPNGKW